MTRILRWFFYAVMVRLVVLVLLGLNVRHRERLPQQGPAILIANHNSHLDTAVLMSLFPLRLLPMIQPVAAMDYFLRNPFLAWFSLNIVGILPIKRKLESRTDNPLLPCHAALHDGQILILFPEGSRGEPERLEKLKSGITLLAAQFPEIPVIPIFLHGLGKSLPKGEGLLVPFFCDVFIGEALYWGGDRKAFMRQLEERMGRLAAEGQFPPWE